MTSDHARCSTEFSGKTRTNPASCVDGVSAESLNEVDALDQRALAAGAQDLGKAQDDGFRYMRAGS